MPANGIQSAAISAIHVGKRHRKEMGDIEALAESIDKLDLLHPIVVTHRGDGVYELVAGLRRLEACKHLKYGTVPIRVIDLEDLLTAERDENELRKDFTPSEAVAIGEAIEAAAKDRANARMLSGKRDGTEPSETFSQGRAKDEIAEAAGMSRPTYEAAKKVVDQGVPELVEMMDAKQVPIATAAAVATLPPKQQEKAVAAGPAGIKAAARKVREKRKPKPKPPVNEEADEPPPKEPPKEEPVCELGIPLPDYLVEPFETKARIKELYKSLQSAARTVDELARLSGGEQLRRRCQPTGTEDKIKFVLTDLKNAMTTLKFSQPYTRCSYCAERGATTAKDCKSCKGCSGTGWLDKSVYEASPADYRERVEKLKAK